METAAAAAAEGGRDPTFLGSKMVGEDVFDNDIDGVSISDVDEVLRNMPLSPQV